MTGIFESCDSTENLEQQGEICIVGPDWAVGQLRPTCLDMFCL